MCSNRVDINDYFYLYEDEIDKLYELLQIHGKHEEHNNITPWKWSIIFNNTSVAVIPEFKCSCGYREIVACEERYDNI